MSESRYSRHTLIPNWSQKKLTEAKVAVVGCGALGNEVLKNLALLGIGQIWVVDYDTIEIHNLTRSVLFRESDIGRAKTEVVAERVRELNPDACIHQIKGKLELAFGRGLLREMDVVLGCLDSVGARRELNRRCYFAGTPWIDGGITHNLGNVALFDPRIPETACYRCKMNTSAWARLNEKYSCGYLKDNYEDPKFATTIMTASVVAAYQVEVAVQLLLTGTSHLKPGTQLFLPVALPAGFRTIEFSLDQECPDHSSIPNNKSTPPQKFSLDNTPTHVANKLNLGNNWNLELPFNFVSRLTCHECGYVESVRKSKGEINKSQTRCPKCQKNGREPTEFFRVAINSEEAKQSFHDFALCDREIIKYVYNKKTINIEVVNDSVNSELGR